MKRTLLVIAGLLMAGQVYAQPFFETEGGTFVGDQTAPLYGAKVGLTIPHMVEGSIGYWGSPGDTSLHTIPLELCGLYHVAPKTTVKSIFDVGYTIPDLPGAERGDNDVSWAFGGGLDQEIGNGMTLGFSLKWFLFRTDTHLTIYGSHTETLSNGQQVEVLDTFHQDNSVNKNALILAIRISWK